MDYWVEILKLITPPTIDPTVERYVNRRSLAPMSLSPTRAALLALLQAIPGKAIT